MKIFAQLSKNKPRSWWASGCSTFSNESRTRLNRFISAPQILVNSKNGVIFCYGRQLSNSFQVSSVLSVLTDVPLDLGVWGVPTGVTVPPTLSLNSSVTHQLDSVCVWRGGMDPDVLRGVHVDLHLVSYQKYDL